MFGARTLDVERRDGGGVASSDLQTGAVREQSTQQG